MEDKWLGGSSEDAEAPASREGGGEVFGQNGKAGLMDSLAWLGPREPPSLPGLGNRSFRTGFVVLQWEKTFISGSTGDPGVVIRMIICPRYPLFIHQLFRKCLLSTYHMTGPHWVVLRTLW